MPIRPPALDDRSFDDLVEELLTRIPAHTPEWTNPRLGDPGRTLVELFAWLADTILYRANLIPERQRLAFLRLLGIPLRPAMPARGLISLAIDDPKAYLAEQLRPLATVKGPVNFETRSEVTVFPVTAAMYYKRPVNDDDDPKLRKVVDGLKQVYGMTGTPTPYVTTPLFVEGLPQPQGFNLIAETVDHCLWIALLAPRPELVERVRQTLGSNPTRGRSLLTLGFTPAIKVPVFAEEIGPRAKIPHLWQICTGQQVEGEPEYLTLDEVADTTAGLTRQGTVRLALPNPDYIGALNNDVRLDLFAGTGDRPPRIDTPELAARLVTWVRLCPARADLQVLSLSWLGINAVEIDQRQTLTGRIVGQSNGSADQVFQLPGLSVDPDTLEVQVEEPGAGYRLWQRVDDLSLAQADERVYRLDSEAGTVQFGNGMRGRIPDPESRIRVALMRAGGGQIGNLPAGSLTGIAAINLQGSPVGARLKVLQSLPTEGGADAETLADAEQRIPHYLRHRDRVVTQEDYKRLTLDTPGVPLGRVEVLPRFKPQQRLEDVPGVVSVMVLPMQASMEPPYPRADRPMLEAVHAFLEGRRPLSTELYVIGCDYVPLGLSIGVHLQDGFGQDTVLLAVREAVRRFLWVLPPGGPTGEGWPLGRPVSEQELEVVVARVSGVNGVRGVRLFQQQVITRPALSMRLFPDGRIPRPTPALPARQDRRWERLSSLNGVPPAVLSLESWQLPELASIVVVAGEAPTTLRPLRRGSGGLGGGEGGLDGMGGDGGDDGLLVPVVPEVC